MTFRMPETCDPSEKINWHRTYGQIDPACNGARFQQFCGPQCRLTNGGHYYDQNGDLMQTGLDGLPVEPETEVVAQETSTDLGVSATSLLKQANDLMPHALKRMARDLLGDDCPGDKQGIINALEAAARQEAGHAPRHASPAARAAAKGAQEAPAPAGQSVGNAGDISLAKWARGEVSLPDAVVHKTIRDTYKGARTSTLRDAALFLIKEGVVTQAEVRDDIKL